MGITKFIVSLYLTAYLIGGGTVCLCEVRSWFGSHSDQHLCDHDHCDHDHDEAGNSNFEIRILKLEAPAHCHCDLKPFCGESTTPLRVDRPTEGEVVFELPGSARLIQEDHGYPAAWKHPPPDRRALFSLPVLQRYNV